MCIAGYCIHFSFKDALIVNNSYGHSDHYEVLSLLIRKKVYCIYKGQIYSQGVIINSVITQCNTNYTNFTNYVLSKSIKISLSNLSL